MSEAFWQVQNALTAGYYIGKESIDMPMSKTKRLKMQAQRKGYRQGERSMNKLNEQTDMVSEDSEDSIMHKAHRAWRKWAENNNINTLNTQPETYQLMAEAFVDGYTNGFVKRFTEGE